MKLIFTNFPKFNFRKINFNEIRFSNFQKMQLFTKVIYNLKLTIRAFLSLTLRVKPSVLSVRFFRIET